MARYHNAFAPLNADRVVSIPDADDVDGREIEMRRRIADDLDDRDAPEDPPPGWARPHE